MSANYESPTEYLLSNLDNKILTITLNRPDALNALKNALEGMTTAAGTADSSKQSATPSSITPLRNNGGGEDNTKEGHAPSSQA